MQKDFSKLNFGVDGDSITAGEQWSWHVYNTLGFASHHNVAVGTAVWYKRRLNVGGVDVDTQEYGCDRFAGISDGWEPCDDPAEMQKRVNNCAVVHIQRFISEVRSGEQPVPDVFAFAMGTNDDESLLGDADKALTGKALENNADIDLYTETGAMRWCIQRIMEEFPKCRLFVLTPIQTATPEHNKKIEKTIANIYKIAGAMSAQVVDCFHNCGICEKFEIEGAQGKYLKDGLHPGEDGQALEGAYAAKEIGNNLF